MKKTILMLLVLSLCNNVTIAKMIITKTMCNYQSGTAVVIDKAKVNWQISSDVNGDLQTAYQIIIKERITNDIVYDSNKTESSESQFISLPSLERNKFGYTWQVKVWDKNNQESEWSAPHHFRIAPSSIDANWIGAITKKEAHIPEGRWANTYFKKDTFKQQWAAVDSLSTKSIILRKDFKTKKNIVDATIYISGLGYYELQMNGVKVGDDEFAPLISEYDKTVYYNTIDVTKYLKSLRHNAMQVILGNGFFNVQKDGRYSKLQTSFGPPQMICLLEINYDDGTQQTIKSDNTWKWCLSPITFNSIYGGESYDATLEGKMPWHNVVITEGPKGMLTPQIAPPIKIMERYGIKSWQYVSSLSLAESAREMKRTNISPTAIIADMGQNLAGFPEISISGKRGQKVIIYVGEKLTKHGVVNQRETGRPHYYEYTLRGNGIDIWHPRFSYYGFRYIQVEGAVMQGEPNPDDLPVIYALNSCFVHNSAQEVSTFKCSNELFTKTHRLIERAQRSNMQAVLTDCPHREKLGWLEQDHLNGVSLLYNYDMTTYIPKIIRDIRDTQKPNGMVPTTAPQFVSFGNLFDDSPEWSSTLIILPFMYYDQYGDSTLILDNYDAMGKYVDYLSSRAKDGILDFGLGDWYDYGPWVAGFSKNTPVPLVATAHYIYDLQLMRKAAAMKNNQDDLEKYDSLCNYVISRFNEHFYIPDSCSYTSGSQCANALPLFLDICGDNKERVLESLIKDIQSHGNRLTTGDVGNRYLIQALVKNNKDSIVFTMFNHYETPGYGFQMLQGATTLTEQWDPRNGTSWNHFMMGQLDEWLFRSVAGIRQKEKTHGMKHLIISPHFIGDITSIEASTKTLYGTVSVNATKSEITASIPVGCSAEITAPNGTIHNVGSGIWNFK